MEQPEAFMQEIAEIPLHRKARLKLCRAKKLEETNSETTTGQHRHPHIIDLCTHQVTCSHDGQGRLAPLFIAIPSGTAKSRGSSGTQFSLVEKEIT